MPHDIPATPPTHAGVLRYIDHNYDLPNKDDIRLWTQGEDDSEDEETVRAMIDAPGNAKEPGDAKEEPGDAKEDLEDARHLYRMVMNRPYD